MENNQDQEATLKELIQEVLRMIINFEAKFDEFARNTDYDFRALKTREADEERED